MSEPIIRIKPEMNIQDEFLKQLDIILNLQSKYGINILSKNWIQIIFLKSIIEDADKYPALDIDGMKILLEYSKCYHENKVDEELLYKTFKVVEKANNLKNNPISSSVPSFRFYLDERNQKIFNDSFRKVVIPNSYDKRKALIRNILFFITRVGKGNESYNISSESIIALASKLLDINENDLVLNSFAGYSSFALSDIKCKLINGYDIDSDCIAISSMIKILCKLDHLNVIQGNFYSDLDDNADAKIKYNKIFTDGPISERYLNMPVMDENNKYNYIRSLDILNLRKTLDLLEEKGLAVITISNRLFYSFTPQLTILRRGIAKIGLKAIILLPNNILYKSSLPINLFIIEKGYQGNILIINGNQSQFYYSSKSFKNIESFSIDKMVSIYKNFEEIEGQSFIIDPNDLFGDGTKLVNLQKYFIDSKNKKHRKIEVIDNDINNVICDLRNINR
jgi:hypothetical protein